MQLVSMPMSLCCLANIGIMLIASAGYAQCFNAAILISCLASTKCAQSPLLAIRAPPRSDQNAHLSEGGWLKSFYNHHQQRMVEGVLYWATLVSAH